MELDELRRIITNQNRQIARRIPGGATAAVASFKVAAPHAAKPVGTMNLNQAVNALGAAHKALAELARVATGSKRVHYKKLMDVVLLELKTVAQVLINKQGQQYIPLTKELKSRAGDLASAYETAKGTISNMNNASEVLSGFGALVGAIK
jgi:hypothetical protein